MRHAESSAFDRRKLMHLVRLPTTMNREQYEENSSIQSTYTTTMNREQSNYDVISCLGPFYRTIRYFTDLLSGSRLLMDGLWNKRAAWQSSIHRLQQVFRKIKVQFNPI